MKNPSVVSPYVLVPVSVYTSLYIGAGGMSIHPLTWWLFLTSNLDCAGMNPQRQRERETEEQYP